VLYANGRFTKIETTVEWLKRLLLEIKPLLYGPAPFASFVEMETDKWARVLKFSGTKAD
jgi:hypothetical protein